MLGTAQAGAKENQDAAGLRATEISNAENTEAGVLGSEANENANLYGTNLTGATNASNQAGTEEGTTEAATMAAKQGEQNLVFNELNPVGSYLAGGKSPSGGGSSGGGSSSAGSDAGDAEAVDAVSDPKAKKDIKPLQDKAMKQFTAKLAGFGFKYKAPGTPGEAPGNRVGVMADKVQQGGPIGKAVVIDGDTLKLDLPNAVGASLAAIGYLAREIKKSKKKAA